MAFGLWVAGIAAGRLLSAHSSAGAAPNSFVDTLGLLPDRASIGIPDPPALLWQISKHNLLVVTLLFCGLVTYGGTATVTLLYNGFRLGWAGGIAQLVGISPLTLAVVILPHGVLESAGFVIAGAVGLRGWSLARTARRSGRFDLGTESPALLHWAAYGVAAVLFAAVIEATVTRALVLKLITNG
jgi:uncharacterized membrane protein SpoIIM required for sporulation